MNTRKNVFLCRGCGARGDVIAFVQHVDRVGFGGAVRLLTNTDRLSTPPPKPKKDRQVAYEADRRLQALAIWNEGRSIEGTLAEAYLHCRGLDQLPGDDVLRFHRKCPFSNDRLPCLLALYVDIHTNKPMAISRTALASDGSKVNRLSLGPTTGSAVKLSADEQVTTGLVIGEGIETVLSAMHLGFRPGWALGSAGAMRTFPVLTAIESLTVVVDADAPDKNGRQAGPDSALECTKRWIAAGREVFRLVPREASADMNDWLLVEVCRG